MLRGITLRRGWLCWLILACSVLVGVPASMAQQLTVSRPWFRSYEAGSAACKAGKFADCSAKLQKAWSTLRAPQQLRYAEGEIRVGSSKESTYLFTYLAWAYCQQDNCPEGKEWLARAERDGAAASDISGDWAEASKACDSCKTGTCCRPDGSSEWPVAPEQCERPGVWRPGKVKCVGTCCFGDGTPQPELDVTRKECDARRLRTVTKITTWLPFGQGSCPPPKRGCCLDRNDDVLLTDGRRRSVAECYRDLRASRSTSVADSWAATGRLGTGAECNVEDKVGPCCVDGASMELTAVQCRERGGTAGRCVRCCSRTSDHETTSEPGECPAGYDQVQLGEVCPPPLSPRTVKCCVDGETKDLPPEECESAQRGPCGTCCYGDDDPDRIARRQCETTPGSSWRRSGPCPRRGNCCLGGALVAEGVTKNRCRRDHQGASWIGSALQCPIIVGPPTGACCYGDGNDRLCEESMTEKQCKAKPKGKWTSGSTCQDIAWTCAKRQRIGACHDETDCLDLAEGQCDALDGWRFEPSQWCWQWEDAQER